MADYKAIKGHTIRTVAGDPSVLAVGDIWYDSVARKVQGAGLSTASWASGGNINTGRQTGCGGGTQTAAIYGAGSTATAYVAVAETYDGSSWTEVGDLSTARYVGGSIGQTQTDAGYAGGYNPGTYVEEVELWNGTSWTEVADLNTARTIGAGGAGTTSAGLVTNGGNPSTGGETEVWNGTSWTEVADLSTGRQLGSTTGETSTAAMSVGGYHGSGFPSTATRIVLTEIWNGTSWTEVGDLNTGRNLAAMSGTTTSAVFVGGVITTGAAPNNSVETWDGSSWTEVANLPAAKDSMGGTSQSGSSALVMGAWSAPINATTEEFTGAVATAVTFTSS